MKTITAWRSLGSTYVLLGTPTQPRGLGRLGGGADRSLLMRLLRELPGVDVRIVADPTLRKPGATRDRQREAEGVEGADAEGVGGEGQSRSR